MKIRMRTIGICAALCVFVLLAAPAHAADRYRVGAGGNWDNTANWSTNSGGAGGASVPGASDIAIFDAGGTGNCAISATVNVSGINLITGYTGTLTQNAGIAIAVGTNGYSQAAGTFAGSDADLTITGNGGFTLSGGVFTAPSGTTSVGAVAGDVTIFTFTGGAFNPNSGTLRFNSYFGNNASFTHAINLNNGSLTVNNLVYTGLNWAEVFHTYALGAGDTFVVLGDFLHEATLLQTKYPVRANSGTIQAHGNVTIKTGAAGGTTVIEMAGSADATYTYTGGKASHLKINKTLFATVTPAAGTTELTVDCFTLAAGTFTAPSGTMSMGSPVTDNITIFTFTGGAFDPNSGTLRFNSVYGYNGALTHTINLNNGSLTVNNLVYTGLNGGEVLHTYALGAGDTFVVLGDFLHEATLPDTKYPVRANSGTIQAHGNVTIKTGAAGGTTLIQFKGANEQAITHFGGMPPTAAWTIDKPSGTVTLATAVALTNATQDLVWTSGGLNLSSNTLSVGRHVTIGADATALGVTVSDALTAGRLAAGGTVSGIGDAGLEVRVMATWQEAQGQTYTILSNAVALTVGFAPVRWTPPWMGTVNYTENSGKNVTLSDIRKASGMIFSF